MFDQQLITYLRTLQQGKIRSKKLNCELHRITLIGVFSVCFTLAIHSTSFAQDSGILPAEADSPPPQQSESITTDKLSDSSLPPLAVDYGFDRIVQLIDIVDVINARDSKSLADIALLTKVAEDTLKRTHRSGVTSGTLLKLAKKLAAQEGDTKTLARLKTVRDIDAVAQSNDLQKEFEEFSFPANTSPEIVELFQGLQNEIKTAILLNDEVRLKRTMTVIKRSNELSSVMKNHLTQSVSSAAKDIKKMNKNNPLQRLLNQARNYASMIYYEHTWGGGATYTIYHDEFQRSNMPSTWNDEVSSVWVRRGRILYSYEHVNYDGARCWVLVTRDGNPGSSPTRQKTQELAGYLFQLNNHGWNDVISSFKLQRR